VVDSLLVKNKYRLLFLLPFVVGLTAAAENIQWLVEYDGRALPDPRQWQAVGVAATNAKIEGGGLRIADTSGAEHGYFQAAWSLEPNREIVVEAKVRVESMTNDRKSGTSMWPFPDGAPIILLVNDGQREGGVVLRPEKIATLVDRVAPMNLKSAFHTLRPWMFRCAQHDKPMRR